MIKEEENSSQTNAEDNLEQSINLYKQRWRNKINQLDRKILNRRKRKLEEMLSSNDPYFSEDAIKQRDPILYEIYVGTHKRKSEISNNQILNSINTRSSISNFLMDELASEIHKGNINEEFEKEISKYGEKEIRESYVK